MMTLDWRPNPDQRNHRYRLVDTDCYASRSERANIRWNKAIFLDQGEEGACTGFGAGHVMASSPRARPVTQDDCQEIYYEARRQDEWVGEDYEGSSVNGAMKALRARGWITSWRWAYSLNEIRHGLSWHGSFEIGVWVYEAMLEPDEYGVIRAEGAQVGGHAMALTGYRMVGPVYQERQYRLENSWGRTWGDDGGAWISESDLKLLLDDQGEFAIPVKSSFQVML